MSGLERSLSVNVSNQLQLQSLLFTPLFPPVVHCDPLRLSTNASGGLTLQFSAPTTTVGSRAVYSCRSSGYQLVGEAERVCGADGNWTGNEPRCEC